MKIVLISFLQVLLLISSNSLSFVYGQNEKVICETTKGDITIEMHKEWAPIGYERFMELVNINFFNDQVLYRMIPGFLVQFGIASNPEIQSKWQNNFIKDDIDHNIPFTHGTISFAGFNGQNSRSCHIFISLEPNGNNLGTALHERPFGRITNINEHKILNNFYSDYGDITHLQDSIVQLGNNAVENYPKLDRIKRCYVKN